MAFASASSSSMRSRISRSPCRLAKMRYTTSTCRRRSPSSRAARSSCQPRILAYSSASAKSALYSLPAPTSSAWASCVPVVARRHQASLAAFSTGSMRPSSRVMNASISEGEGKTRLAGGPLAPVAQPDHDEQEDHAQGAELQQPLRLALAPHDEHRHEDEAQPRVPGRPVGEVRDDQPDEGVQDRQEGGERLEKRQGPGVHGPKRPEPQLAGRDESDEGGDEADSARPPGNGLWVELVRLVPAGVAYLVAPPAPHVLPVSAP